MTQLLSKSRQLLTPHLTDRLFNINPEFTWDIHEFVFNIIILVNRSQGLKIEKYFDS